ncbi:T9SS type A sorting domain-containing protein [Hymenobacter sp. M29]|uniref:T9SS type A sorting domain-containing protein n=1 Tax=Hymenobacter mellowenesis TaxID=3063995 RepID=A0ABT9A9Q8_9BACT|nr:T9SS type A sorting domain-containing protein [Hymenobacter sp. M29]MDO7846571.1 T9SS type A sorting domain-containing protein [Hymenobacter sp. M29]
MKTLTSLLRAGAAALLLAAPARAQTPIANASFETWAGTPEKPAGWLTTDDVYAAVFGVQVATGTVRKSPAAHSGTFAAQLQTTTAQGLGTNAGTLVLGSALSINAQFDFEKIGQPYTGRPASLQFYYRLSGPLTDSAGVALELTRRVNGQRVVVGYAGQPGRAGYPLPALAAAYTLATVPIQYVSNLPPDSVRISFTSGEADVLTAGTTLLIDDVALVGGTLPTRTARAETALLAYPNPSPDGRFTLQLPAPTAAAEVRVTDALGREVAREAWANAPRRSQVLNLLAQPAGLYTVRVLTAAGLAVCRISIR